MTQDETCRRVQAQFGCTADAYVASASHAQGAELEQMVVLAEALHSGAMAEKIVLDVATGGGHTALAFARAGAQVTATDPTPEMLRVAGAFVRTEGQENVRFVAAPAEQLPFAASSFDLITCRVAAHHFADPEQFVREAARVLRAGGLLLLVDNVSPEAPALAALMNDFERQRDPSHVSAYSVRRWVTWCAEAGLEPQHLSRWYVDKPYHAWLERARTPADVGEVLARDVLALPAAQKVYFRVRAGEEGLESLAHEAGLLVGKKQ
jgi:ubiquinone/menaquinone biosynthesis C-methylase UbiE